MERFKPERTLLAALQWAKREWMKYKKCNYPSVDSIWDVAKFKYHLREDEKQYFFNSMNKWHEKNWWLLGC